MSVDLNEAQNLQETKAHENAFWSRVFSDEIKKDKTKKKEDFSSYWWKQYYEEMTEFVKSRLTIFSNPTILEAGSGSGKASILLGKNLRRTFLDISAPALDYAKYLAHKFEVSNIDFIEGDIFRMPFLNEQFDFTWNIGVVEHYEPALATQAFREMVRVTKHGGFIALGVPNFSSGPILKARILKHPWLARIPGYRTESERDYNERELKSLLVNAAQAENREIKNIEIVYFGNPLPMETPALIMKTFGWLVARIAPKHKFLRFVIANV